MMLMHILYVCSSATRRHTLVRVTNIRETPTRQRPEHTIPTWRRSSRKASHERIQGAACIPQINDAQCGVAFCRCSRHRSHRRQTQIVEQHEKKIVACCFSDVFASRFNRQMTFVCAAALNECVRGVCGNTLFRLECTPPSANGQLVT